MTPSTELTAARRQAMVDLAGPAARLRLLDALTNTLVNIPLATPCGTVDAGGVALADTDYGQVLLTGDVATARLESAAGVAVGTFSVGLATDVPAPELPLPALRLYAGSFIRLTGSHIACD